MANSISHREVERRRINQEADMSTAMPATPSGAVTGAVRVTLRLENFAVLLALLGAYHMQHASWGLFAALFLTPDLAMLPYLSSRRAGALAYDLAHSYIGPAVMLAAAFALPAPALLPIATIWASHIAFDRAMGYGLKYATAFGDTHLGVVGRAAQAR
jgi:hypothetical protein